MDFNKEVTAAHLNATGWVLDNCLVAAATPFDSHFFYIRDFRDESVRLYSVTLAAFDLVRIPAEYPVELVDHLVSLLSRISSGELEIAATSAFCELLTLYVKTTRTYCVWQGMMKASDRFHMVINIYPAGSNSVSLRPFMISSETPVASLEQVLSTSSDVARLDRITHPQWFAA